MKKRKIVALAKNILRIYNEQHIPIASAGFSYYMMLSVFPLIICLYTILGNLLPATEQMRAMLSAMLPQETVRVVLDFLHYVSGNLSTGMSVAALTVMVTSASALYRLINNIMTDMRGRSRFSDNFKLVFSFLFAILFLIAMLLGVVLVATGKWFLDLLDRYIMFMNISDSWSWWRFVLLFLLLYAIISGLYKFTAPKSEDVRIVPGAVAASVALVAIGLLFSYFIGLSTKYPLVYGSLGSIIIMLFWFYICGLILFVGNALNVSMEQLQ